MQKLPNVKEICLAENIIILQLMIIRQKTKNNYIHPKVKYHKWLYFKEILESFQMVLVIDIKRYYH